MKTIHKSLILALAMALLAPVARAQQTEDEAYKALGKWEFGQSRAPLAIVEEQIRKTAPSGYAQIESRLLEVLNDNQTPRDAKRFTCRYLGIVGSAKSVPALAALLPDPEVSHPARIALEAIADPAATDALRSALSKIHESNLLAGLIGSIGVKRDPQAVGPLAQFAAHAEPVIAGAAISALGAIGTEQSLAALNTLKAPENMARTVARAKIAAAAHLAKEGKRDAAVAVYNALFAPSPDKAVRIAALKGLIGAQDRATAVRLVMDMLQGDDADMRTATVSAYVASSDKALKDAVAEQLPALKPAGQLLLLNVLADEGEVAARPAILKVLSSTQDPQVRTAALEALVKHGEPADVAALVNLASQGDSAAAARSTLERMNKAGVDEAIAAIIETGDAAARKVVLGVLAARRAPGAMPILVRIVGANDAAVAAEAARALGAIGGPDQLPALVNVVVSTPDNALRSAASAAIRDICTRAPDKAACARAVLPGLQKAATPRARVAVINLLAYARGPESLDAVRAAMSDANAEVADAATRTLIDWPEISAAPYLFDLARNARDARYTVLALRGANRLAGLKDQPIAERAKIYANVLSVASRPEEKKQAIAGLADLPSLEALAALQKASADPAVRDDATAAILKQSQQIKAVYNKQALAALNQLKAQATTDDQRRQIDEAITAVQNAGQSPDGTIIAWMMSDPYPAEEGKDMFRTAYPPEKKGSAVNWRPAAPSPDGKIEFNKILGGDNRVIYLRTRISSTREQDAQLEFGSDDGIKVWLNGKLIHSNNANRPCTPGQDKVKVKLASGANDLLLKITQGGGEWAAHCRLRAADGKEISNVSVAPAEQ